MIFKREVSIIFEIYKYKFQSYRKIKMEFIALILINKYLNIKVLKITQS